MSEPQPVIEFYGVRGSIATPGKKTAGIGGNTACVTVSVGDECLIFDAGTGIRAFAQTLSAEQTKNIHLFFTHFHFDHICGLPFFNPLYSPNATITLSGPRSDTHHLKQVLESLFSDEFFPVPFKNLSAKLELNSMAEQTIKVGPFFVHSFVVNHPGKTLGYLIDIAGKKIVFLPDHENIRTANHIQVAPELYHANLVKKIQGADILIHDAHFFSDEYLRFKGWGHSDWNFAVSLAREACVKKLFLYHHAPEHSDANLELALYHLIETHTIDGLTVELAREKAAETV